MSICLCFLFFLISTRSPMWHSVHSLPDHTHNPDPISYFVCLFVCSSYFLSSLLHKILWSARVWSVKTFENTFIGAFILLSSVPILGLYRPQNTVPVNWQRLGTWGAGMGLIKHHPGPRPYRWTMHVSLGSELCRGGVVRGDAVSTDPTANTVSANMVIVALQLPHKARI